MFREDLSEFHYLTMFIKESMRLYPPVPVIGRYLNKPLNVPSGNSGNITLPAGCNVGVHIFSQHRNPHVWENPEVGIELTATIYTLFNLLLYRDLIRNALRWRICQKDLHTPIFRFLPDPGNF